MDDGVSLKNKSVETALHVAARKGNIEILPILTAKMTDINPQDCKGCTPVALEYEQTACAKYLIPMLDDVLAKNNRGQTALHLAAGIGHLEIILMLRMTNINPQDLAGNTPLHEALDHKQIETAKSLIPIVDDVSLKNESGQCAFRCQTWKCRIGTNVNCKNGQQEHCR